jgi:hypothetical protein
MGTRKDQHKAGIPAKPRGQQTGFAGNPDQNREEMDSTPALRGRRKNANKMFGDSSEQHIAGNPVTPSTNAPSTVVNVASKRRKKRMA